MASGSELGYIVVEGPIGVGKTTLARLLFRMYDPQEGAVRLGGAYCRCCCRWPGYSSMPTPAA